MQMIEANIAERGSLPLPAAALVIDMRGISDDEVIEWLSIEVADLASEMKTHDVYHWRYLTDFLWFSRITPTRLEEGKATSNGTQARSAQRGSSHGPLGLVHPVQSGLSLFLSEEDEAASVVGEMPFDIFEQKIDELVQDIDRVRNNRIAAVADLNKAGIPGRSSRDSTVRVIFLTDAERPDSLTSAALYADCLKEHYRKLNRPGHQELINTTILCLSNSGVAGPPEKLIKGLIRNNGWQHIDSLIVSEVYREDAALIGGTVQAYLAELLLYVLLIIPPFNVGDSPPEIAAQSNGKNGQKGHMVSLPLNTYVIGLAALEYSSRWGRRWLNFGLAKEVISVLMREPQDESKERKRAEGAADAWFQDWHGRVQETVPDDIPGDVPAMEGIHHARQVADTSERVFTAKSFGFNIGESTISDLEAYQSKLAHTYIPSAREPALQNALLQGGGQVMQELREHEQKSLAERTVTDLGKLQVEAEQVLSHPRFLPGATGSVPRAKRQLRALGATISSFQQEHYNNPLNPTSANDELQSRREALEQQGNKMIANLKKHLGNWPFFSRFLHLKTVLAAFALLLIMLLSSVVILTIAAWLRHLILLQAGPSSFIDGTLLGLPILAIIAYSVVILVLAGELIKIGPGLINRRLSALRVEAIFLGVLVACLLVELSVGASVDRLRTLEDAVTSLGYLAWLTFVPGLVLITFLFIIVVILGELIYTLWWFDHLQRERERILGELRSRYLADVKDVTNFIGDDITLEILQRAELTDGQGGLGGYYFRIARLCDMLADVARQTRHQQQMAANRLLLSQSETQQGAGIGANGRNWLNLHIRDEKLEIQPLTDRYKALKQQLTQECGELKELAEFLLRLQGVEKPTEIGEQLEERPSKQSGEQRQLHLLITSLVAIAMRFGTEPLSINTIDPITQQYKSANDRASEHMPTLNALIKSLNKQVSQATLQAVTEGSEENYQQTGFHALHSNVVTEAVATWGQLFWQNKNPRLDQALMLDGVLPQLVRLLQEDYDPRAVMRHLLAHTAFFGRTLKTGRHADLYLLLSPSLESYKFRQGLKSLRLPQIIEFPDVERVLLLGVQHFVAEPMFLPEPTLLPEPTPAPALIAAANGTLPSPDPGLQGSASHPNTINGTVVNAGTMLNPTGGMVVNSTATSAPDPALSGSASSPHPTNGAATSSGTPPPPDPAVQASVTNPTPTNGAAGSSMPSAPDPALSGSVTSPTPINAVVVNAGTTPTPINATVVNAGTVPDPAVQASASSPTPINAVVVNAGTTPTPINATVVNSTATSAPDPALLGSASGPDLTNEPTIRLGTTPPPDPAVQASVSSPDLTNKPTISSAAVPDPATQTTVNVSESTEGGNLNSGGAATAP